MGRAVGLDIGSRTIKVVELSGTPKSFRVQRVAIRPVPLPEAQPAEGEIVRDPDEVISETIREVFDSLKLPRDDVCAAFDSGATVFREILVPLQLLGSHGQELLLAIGDEIHEALVRVVAEHALEGEVPLKCQLEEEDVAVRLLPFLRQGF